MKIDTSEIFKKFVDMNADILEDKMPIYYDEENLAKEHENDFNYQIRQRGLDYYHDNNVLNVFKDKNKYIAKVMGNDVNPYKVIIEVNEDDISYSCTCPCTFNCKHEYAALLAISNKEYLELKLKETIKEEDASLKTVIEKIPAEEIKKYLLSETGMNNVVFETESFANYFRKYYPVQKYEYYYNNLYNAISVQDDYLSLTENYFARIKQYIAGNSFDEVLNIIKAIINAYKDTNKLNFDDDFTDMLPKIGMFLRVTYRKADESIKEKINEWVSKLQLENFYNNYYLEDIMLSIKSILVFNM